MYYGEILDGIRQFKVKNRRTLIRKAVDKLKEGIAWPQWKIDAVAALGPFHWSWRNIEPDTCPRTSDLY